MDLLEMNAVKDDVITEWHAYEGGTTIGEIGPERGTVLRDEELGDLEDEEAADARITLERGRTANAGYFVTATLYGWMFHTTSAPDLETAETTYERMQGDLVRLAAMLPYEEDRDVESKARRLASEVTNFESRYR